MKLIVSSPPHWHVKLTEARIHLDFIIALIPVVIFSLLNYGMHGARVIALSISVAMLTEIFSRKLFKRKLTLTDGSSFLTGLLFALILPPSVPFWLVIVGAFICIFIGKEIFGGLGSNPLSPVLVGWAVLEISWPAYLDYHLASVGYNLGFDFHLPLTMLKRGGTQAIADLGLMDLFVGNQVGGIGSVAIFLVLIGGIYLLIRRVITWEIPMAYIVGLLAMGTVFWLGDKTAFANPLFHLFTGNAMMGIFFLSTDYSSSPFNRWGMIIFGLSCGFLTIIFRAWSIHVDGVVYAILIMNLFTPLLDNIKKKPVKVEVNTLERTES